MTLTAQLWAIQSKLNVEDVTKALVDAFQKLGLSWAAFPRRPFDPFIPDFKWDGPVIYYGSTKLIQHAWENRAKSGAVLFYDPVMHSTSWYGPRLGDVWLNHGAEVLTVGELLCRTPTNEVFFVRLDSSLKSFSGMCDSSLNIFDTLSSTLNHKAINIEDTIILNRPIEILREYRTWVINGKVAAVVGYKNGSRVRPWDVEEYEGAPITEFAVAQWAKLAALEAFVLDVAVTNEGLKVVEINDVHASGFYRTEHILDVVAELANYVGERHA